MSLFPINGCVTTPPGWAMGEAHSFWAKPKQPQAIGDSTSLLPPAAQEDLCRQVIWMKLGMLLKEASMELVTVV